MVPIESFEDALQMSECYSNRHLFLGNGFSIAACPTTFPYRSLKEQADFSSCPRLERAFDVLQTSDFEHVIGSLQTASQLVPLYSSNLDTIQKQFRADAEELKEVLIGTITSNHPAHLDEIGEHEVDSCRKFLGHFLDPKRTGYVFTVNYDLLLYWAILASNADQLDRRDGFGGGVMDEGHLRWGGPSHDFSQRVHYLHGALHLCERRGETVKLKYGDDNPILSQVAGAIREDRFPLFITEGTSTQKISRIARNPYLHHSYEQFSLSMKEAKDCLFVFGHRLSDADRHIRKAIAAGTIPHLFVSVHGGENSDSGKDVIAQTKALALERKPKPPLQITYFDADSAQVWQ